MLLLPRKTAATILSFAALMFALSVKKMAPSIDLAAVLDFQPRAGSPEKLPEPARVATTQQAEAPAVETVETKPAFAQLVDQSHALEAFYKALQRTESGKGVTRVLHYGDSPVTADSITADARSLLQERFGDAGHGFVLVAKPWAWYAHRGVDIRSSGWRTEPGYQGDRTRDGLNGLGGVAFEGGPGAFSILRLESAHDSVEVSFLEQPLGGVFKVYAGSQPLGTVKTFSPQLKPGWATFPLPASAREIRFEVESGAVRLFGASFEKRAPGVIYNSLGLNGGQVQVVVRYFERAHWAEQLQHQRPDLVVVNYGTNESLFPKYLDTAYPGELRTVIARIKEAVPEASILVMSPMDRGQKDATGQISTIAAVPHIVAIQREVAAETGCAFFNTFEAMGGEGTMGRWYASQPRLVTADFIHPFPAGARKIGILLDDALTSGYERYKGGNHRAGLPRNAAIGEVTELSSSKTKRPGG